MTSTSKKFIIIGSVLLLLLFVVGVFFVYKLLGGGKTARDETKAKVTVKKGGRTPTCTAGGTVSTNASPKRPGLSTSWSKAGQAGSSSSSPLTGTPKAGASGTFTTAKPPTPIKGGGPSKAVSPAAKPLSPKPKGK